MWDFSKGIAYDQVRWERDIAISQLNDLGVEFGEKIERDSEMKYRTEMYKRKHITVDNGTMGFHDYEKEYQSIAEFFDMVNKAMDILKFSGSKKISVQYLKNSDGEIDTAIVTYC